MTEYKKTLEELKEFFEENIDEQYIVDLFRNAGVYPELSYSMNFESVPAPYQNAFKAVKQATISDTPISIEINSSTWNNEITVSKKRSKVNTVNISPVAA